MPFSIEEHGKLERELRKILLEQMRRAIVETGNPDTGVAVHQARKRCKKCRGLLRLLRPADEGFYQEGNAFFRDTSRLLGGFRDHAVLMETYDALMDFASPTVDPHRFSHVRGELTRRQQDYEGRHQVGQALEQVRLFLEGAEERFAAADFPEGGIAMVAKGFEKTYRRGVKARKVAMKKPTVENLHTWRKRAKYSRYHLKILQNLWPSVMEPMRASADRLGSLLGDHHDLAVLRALLSQQPRGFGSEEDLAAFLNLLEARMAMLETAAFATGSRFYAFKPKATRQWIKQLWKNWKLDVQNVEPEVALDGELILPN